MNKKYAVHFLFILFIFYKWFCSISYLKRSVANIWILDIPFVVMYVPHYGLDRLNVYSPSKLFNLLRLIRIYEQNQIVYKGSAFILLLLDIGWRPGYIVAQVETMSTFVSRSNLCIVNQCTMISSVTPSHTFILWFFCFYTGETICSDEMKEYLDLYTGLHNFMGKESGILNNCCPNVHGCVYNVAGTLT